jgi:transcriptional regulator with XRE-family HTH domain
MRLKAARTRMGLPQDQLGVLAGLEESSSSARMSRYETGTHLPDERFAKRLADVLNVPLAYLYCDDDLVADILLRIGAMPVAKQKQLLRFLDQST